MVQELHDLTSAWWGCTTCANLCLGNAISFPDIKEVREIYSREGIWAKVKKQLAEEGKLLIRKE